jgi:hypothetical protein
MKLTHSLFTVSIVTAMLSGCINVNASSIDKRTTERLNLNSAGIAQLEVEAGAGFIIVEGDQSLDTIEVKGDLAVYDNQYEFSLVKKGNKAILIANANSSSISSWFGGDSPKIDLTIKVPYKLSLSVDDGSGNIEISNLDGNVEVEDGSGNIEISNIVGNVEVNDGSGNISLENVTGSVEVEDGSGNLTLTDISGAIKVDDGSGDLKVEKAGASVNIKDGSGEIVLVGAVGKASIDDGSGDLLVEQIKGHVTIEDGSGDIEVVDLENGLTILNAGSGSLSMKKVQGEIVTK